jgi:hypothetical protein
MREVEVTGDFLTEITELPPLPVLGLMSLLISTVN